MEQLSPSRSQIPIFTVRRHFANGKKSFSAQAAKLLHRGRSQPQGNWPEVSGVANAENSSSKMSMEGDGPVLADSPTKREQETTV